MKILITGATGLIGRQIAKLLLDRGEGVNFLTTDKAKLHALEGCEGFLWNPQQCSIDLDALIGVDAIIHLAGAPISAKWTDSYKQEIVESRVLSANVLYKALRQNPHQVKQVISASGIGIYPDSTTNIYTEEDFQPSDDFIGNVVLKWEASANAFRRLGTNVCIMRTGMVLSGNGGALPEMEKIVKTGFASPLGSGRQYISWISLEDLASMYVFALDNRLEGSFNAVAPNPVTNAEFMVSLAKAMSKPYFMPRVPKFALNIILGEMHTLLVKGQNVSAEKISSTGFVFKHATLTDILTHLYKKSPAMRS